MIISLKSLFTFRFQMKYMRQAQHHLFLLAFVRSFYEHSFLVQTLALSMQRHYLHDIKGVTLTGLVDIVQPPEWMASYWSLSLTQHLMKWMLKHFPVRVSDIFLAKWVSRKNFGKLYIFVDIAPETIPVFSHFSGMS